MMDATVTLVVWTVGPFVAAVVVTAVVLMGRLCYTGRHRLPWGES